MMSSQILLVGPGRAGVGVDAVRRRRRCCPRLIRSNLAPTPAPAADGSAAEGMPIIAEHWRCVAVLNLCNCAVMESPSSIHSSLTRTHSNSLSFSMCVFCISIHVYS